jgi:hypothetical protein
MRRSVLAAVLLLALPACKKPSSALASVLIEGIPFVRQKPDFCGEADVEMVLKWRGSTITQDQVFDLSDTDPVYGRGAYTKELRLALERLRFRPGATSYSVPAQEGSPALAGHFRALVADLERGTPSIVCINTGGPDSSEHFILAIGYDAGRDELIFHDPALEYGALRRMPRAAFLRQWPLRYASDTWTVIRMAMAGDPPRRLPPADGFAPSAYAQHILALRRKLPAGFAVRIERPFVLVGNLSERAMGLLAEHIRDDVKTLRQDYFPRDMDRILDVWLLKDDASYRAITRRITGEDAGTPYGFYSARHGVLIMNIATGGGTLLHELVHPFMAANFRECPPWFNEGLGSLHERCERRNGHLVGLPNWRLPGLQQAIRDGEVPSLVELLHYDQATFYDEDHSLHYAMARYLVYALQERGVLLDFFRRWQGNLAQDPSGERTLNQVLGTPALSAFQPQWQAEILRLRE